MNERNKPVYARPGAADFGTRPQEGLTYREWLVGMALSGAVALGHGEYAGETAVAAADRALRALERAP